MQRYLKLIPSDRISTASACEGDGFSPADLRATQAPPDCASNMCSGGSCVVTNWASCQAVKDANPSAQSGVYSLTIGGNMYGVWCEMINNNGWTLVLTADGNDPLWHYDNGLWSSESEINSNAYVTKYSTLSPL